MQETHSTLESEQKWRTEWNGDIFFSHGDSKSKGTAILINSKRINPTIYYKHLDSNGRIVILDLEIGSNRLTLANVYAPNTDDVEFFRSLISLIEATPNDDRIICGDLNLVLNLDLDKKGGSRSTHFQIKVSTF